MSARPAGESSVAKHIAIIGAGPAGLAAAYDLARARHVVAIYEAAPEVGGLAAGFKATHWDWTLEKFYHHWFASDRHMLGLIAELGWRDQVVFRRPYTVVYYQGQFQPLDSYSEALKFTIRHFSLLDLVRFGLVGMYLRLTPWWQPLESVTADAWMRKWVGSRIYDTLWKPLLVGKFGEANLNVVNMAWLWARIKARTTRLGTFAGGFQAFLDRLAEVVRSQGTEIFLNRPVTGITVIQGEPTGRLVLKTRSESVRYDAVISTSSPALMARLAPELPDSYTAGLRALKSMGAVVLVITLKHQLTQYYWHNLPKEAGFPFLAMVEHTNFIGPEHFGGDHIIYCGDYLNPDHEYFALSKEQLLERFLPALKRFNPEFNQDWVRETWLWKTAYAQPVPPVNHSRNIPSLRTPIPGLYFASMSQVYPWDRGTNFAVEIGRRVARMAIEDLGAERETLGPRDIAEHVARSTPS
jgi:protoporphyrinogen oxidase